MSAIVRDETDTTVDTELVNESDRVDQIVELARYIVVVRVNDEHLRNRDRSQVKKDPGRGHKGQKRDSC